MIISDPANAKRIVGRVLPFITIAIYLTVVTVGAFSGGLWGAAGIGCGLILYSGTAYVTGKWPRPSWEFLRLALVSLAVMAVLNLGSSSPALSWHDWLRLVTIFIPLVLLTSPEVQAHAYHRHLFIALILATIIAAFALGVELFLGAPVLHAAKGSGAVLTRYNRGLSYLIMLALPVMGMLATRPLDVSGSALRRIAAWIAPLLVFVAILLFPAGLTESRSSKLALVVALLVVGATYIRPVITRRALTVCLALLLLWPFVVQKLFPIFLGRLKHLPDSWRARIEIWDYMSYRIAEHPLLGWGLGTSRTLDYRVPHGGLYQFTHEAAPHPHNVVTQLWVELGMPGLVLGMLFALLVLRHADRLSAPLKPYAFGAWAAALCLSLVAYNFWTDSMFSAFALTGLAFALLERRYKAQ